MLACLCMFKDTVAGCKAIFKQPDSKGTALDAGPIGARPLNQSLMDQRSSRWDSMHRPAMRPCHHPTPWLGVQGLG